MRLASFSEGGGARVGVVRGDEVHDVTDWLSAHTGTDEGPMDMPRLLRAGRNLLTLLAAHITDSGQGRPIADVELLAPVPRPGKIVAIGRNYADHARETNFLQLNVPRIIAKLASATCAPGVAVRRPPGVSKLDFEIELAVIIGRTARCVSEEEAMDYVAGFTILDDLTAREFQFDVSPPQTTFAKSMDSFAPMGPWLVTTDEIGDPQSLDLLCSVNGEVVQHGNTRDMQFPIASLIAYISRFVTLDPGDVLATGTPAGSGAFRTPPRYLQPGDRLRLEIERIGVLEHSIA